MRRRCLYGVPNKDRARKMWEELDGDVRDRRRTGEECYTHPELARPIIVNKRRKDTPRVLLLALRRLLKSRAVSSA